jgi:sRNA-binding carbon storage regulator CsrA
MVVLIRKSCETGLLGGDIEFSVVDVRQGAAELGLAIDGGLRRMRVDLVAGARLWIGNDAELKLPSVNGIGARLGTNAAPSFAAMRGELIDAVQTTAVSGRAVT